MCQHETNILDVIYKISTVIIASINILFAYIIFRKKNKSDLEIKEKERKLFLLKTLIFDPKISEFYEYLNELSNVLSGLKEKELTIALKSEINSSMLDIVSKLRYNFIELLTAIDDSLRDKILNDIDECTDKITRAIFDKGINLFIEEKYNENILTQITDIKIKVIRSFFEYKGKN